MNGNGFAGWREEGWRVWGSGNSLRGTVPYFVVYWRRMNPFATFLGYLGNFRVGEVVDRRGIIHMP